MYQVQYWNGCYLINGFLCKRTMGRERQLRKTAVKKQVIATINNTSTT